MLPTKIVDKQMISFHKSYKTLGLMTVTKSKDLNTWCSRR
jgi:hypothetical protein